MHAGVPEWPNGQPLRARPLVLRSPLSEEGEERLWLSAYAGSNPVSRIGFLPKEGTRTFNKAPTVSQRDTQGGHKNL